MLLSKQTMNAAVRLQTNKILLYFRQCKARVSKLISSKLARKIGAIILAQTH